MVKTTRWWWTSLVVVGSMLMAFAGSNTAQEKKAYEKHDTTALYNSLRDVINNGAKLFNEQGDHAGCYRLYQGSLLSVRPFLAPDLQKKIDAGVLKAEGMQSFSERAFELRKILDDVRTQVKPAGSPVTPIEKKKEETKKEEKKKEVEKKKEETKKEEKKKEVEKKKEETKKEEKKKEVEKKKEETKKEEKKKEVEKKKEETKKEEKKKEVEKKKEETKKEEKKKEVEKKKEETKKEIEKKKEEKKVDEKKADEKKTALTGDKGQVAGKIMYQGKTIAGGFFVTLISGEGKKFSSAIQKDGTFQFKTPIPAGDYRIAVEAIPGEKLSNLNLPARYRTETTSGLSVRVQTGRQQLDLDLTN